MSAIIITLSTNFYPVITAFCTVKSKFHYSSSTFVKFQYISSTFPVRSWTPVRCCNPGQSLKKTVQQEISCLRKHTSVAHGSGLVYRIISYPCTSFWWARSCYTLCSPDWCNILSHRPTFQKNTNLGLLLGGFSQRLSRPNSPASAGRIPCQIIIGKINQF